MKRFVILLIYCSWCVKILIVILKMLIILCTSWVNIWTWDFNSNYNKLIKSNDFIVLLYIIYIYLKCSIFLSLMCLNRHFPFFIKRKNLLWACLILLLLFAKFNYLNCIFCYMGQTQRSLITRIRQHQTCKHNPISNQCLDCDKATLLQ